MRNVVLTRVDERLIHGQVMTSWLKLCNANVILIIDAGSASNAFLKRILFAAAPKDVELQVMNEADAAAYLKEDSPAGEKVLVLSKTPQPLLAMVRSGIEIKEIRDLVDAGVYVYCQMVPSDAKEDVKKLLK